MDNYEQVAIAMGVLMDPELTEELAETILAQHRTNQQQILRGVLKIVEEAADAYMCDRFDLRNEVALKACRDAKDGMGDLTERFPYV